MNFNNKYKLHCSYRRLLYILFGFVGKLWFKRRQQKKNELIKITLTIITDYICSLLRFEYIPSKKQCNTWHHWFVAATVLLRRAYSWSDVVAKADPCPMPCLVPVTRGAVMVKRLVVLPSRRKLWVFKATHWANVVCKDCNTERTS